MKNILFIIFLLLCSITTSCVGRKEIKDDDCITEKFVNSSDTLQGEFIFAKEICSSPNHIDFCFDGIGQLFRINSGGFIIDFDSNHILKSYKEGYFTTSFPLKIDSILSIDGLDTLFELNEKFDSTSFFKVENKTLNKNIGKYYKQNSISKGSLKFDGFFYFEFYIMKIKYIDTGKKCILVPNFETKSRCSNNYIQLKCQTYNILEIKTIKSYRGNVPDEKDIQSD